MRGSSLGSWESSWAGDTRCTMYPIASTTAIRSWRIKEIKSVLVDSFGTLSYYIHAENK